MQLSVKYFSNKTSTGIIRCGRAAAQTVVAALTLIDRIENTRLTIRCTRVSGTIKKCENYAIAQSRLLMRLIAKNGLELELARFTELESPLGSTQKSLTETISSESDEDN